MSKAKAVEIGEGDGQSAMIDFSQVDEMSFEVLPKGKYDAIVHAIEYKYSAAGNPMWALQLSIEGGDYDGRRLFSHITFSEAALSYAKSTLANIAPHLLEESFDPSNADVYSQFQGMAVSAQVAVGTYNNEPSNNVKQLFARGEESSFT